MTDRKSTPEDERLIKDDSAPWGPRAAAVRNVAADGLHHLEANIARLLDHEWEGLRAQAISALVMFWAKEAYLLRAFSMLIEDPEEAARGTAAFALAGYARYTGKSRDKILRALARVVQSDPAPSVVRRAYVGMVQLQDPERKTSTIPDEIDRARDIDWKLIQQWRLTTTGSTRPSATSARAGAMTANASKV